MIRIQPISKDTATEKQQAILTTVQKAMGGVPNLISTMAQSPAVATAYLGFSHPRCGGSPGWPDLPGGTVCLWLYRP